MDMPEHVPDDMLLVEAARAWYGVRDPVTNPVGPVRGLIDLITTSTEAPESGPPLPMSAQMWTTVLLLKDQAQLPRALVTSRRAMLLYHGLMGMDDETLRWIGTQRWLLRRVLEKGAPAFAFAAPSVRVRDGAVVVPGGDAARSAWESILGERAAKPESFVRALIEENDGRLAWLYSVLAELDAPRLRFALGPDASELPALVRAAVDAAPEWKIADRPFWRPAFDLSLVLSMVELQPDGAPRGSIDFWREVFRGDMSTRWLEQRGGPLTSGSLLEYLFKEPYSARNRWEVFALGQRMPAVERNDANAGRALRAARRHPALAAMLDRIGVTDAALVLALHDASARVSDRDESGSRGELGMWQGALAVVERAALTGGFDPPSASMALGELAALPLEEPRAELAAWLLGALLPRLSTRPGAADGAERVLLDTIAGALTPSGPPARTPFTWEELPYVAASAEAISRRMRKVRSAQHTLTLDDAVNAWRIASGEMNGVSDLVTRLGEASSQPAARDLAEKLEEASRRRDAASVRRDARRAAELVAATLLPALAYLPHQAATEEPELGADIAFRHSLVTSEGGPDERRLRPWQIARAHARTTAGWQLQGSLLLLDVPLSNWYLRRNGEQPASAPAFDEVDVMALAQVAAIGRSSGASGLGVAEAAAGIDEGRRRVRNAAADGSLEALLRDAGIDAWRRRALMLAGSGDAIVEALGLGEAWRIAGAPGRLAPRPSLDGCVCFGGVPRARALLEGRRSTGIVGAAAVDTQLRVAVFLRKHGLPDDLYAEVAAGALNDIIEQTRAIRPDDFQAIACAAERLSEGRMEEHVLALVADDTLARPAEGKH